MDTRLQRRSPGRGINSSPFVMRTRKRLPIHKERDRIFSVFDAVVRLAGGDARRRTRYNTRRHGLALQDPAADVDVMRREIIAGKN